MSTWISIKRPTCALNAPGRSSECREALYGAFHDLRQQAQKAGWERREVDWAMMLLAGADLRAANANTDTADALEKAMGKSADASIPHVFNDPADSEQDIGLDLVEKHGAAGQNESTNAEDVTPTEDEVTRTGVVVDAVTEDATNDPVPMVMPSGPALPYDVDHLESDEAKDQKGPWKALVQLAKRR